MLIHQNSYGASRHEDRSLIPAFFTSSPLYPSIDTEAWIGELFSKSDELERLLILKTDVSHQWIAAVELLERKAQAYLREHPLSYFDSRILDTYYLVSKKAYNELVNDSLPSDLLPDFEPTTSEPMETSSGTTNGAAPTLGYKDLIFDSSTDALNEKLIAEKAIGSESSFVSYFNEHISERKELVQVALLRIEILYNQIYRNPSKRDLVVKDQIPSTREGLILLFECEDPSIKKHSLKRLIDVLQADPIDPESYLNLPKHIERLMEYISLSSSQNLDISILAKLIEAYALTCNNIWLHAEEKADSATIIHSDLRAKIWDKASEFQRQNTQKNPAINFWINFAIQAIQRVSTETSTVEDVGKRVYLFSKAILRFAIMGASTYTSQNQISIDGIESSVKDIVATFSHIPFNSSWFEALLAFKYICHVVRYYPNFMPQLTEMALRYKTNEQDINLFFGIVSSLESLILHTTDPKIAESALKTLITLLFLDNKFIQARIVEALFNMKESGKETLSLTSEALLLLVFQGQNDLKDLFPSSFWNKTVDFSTRFKDLNEGSKTLCTHVMSLLMRFTIDITTESGMASESLMGQLTRSMPSDLDGNGSMRVENIMKALHRILPNPFTPDLDGNSFIHLCIKRGNADLIPLAIKNFPDSIDPNAINHDGQTALMLCAAPGFPIFLEGIEILADVKTINPNIKDKHGRTFWHYLVETATPEEVEHILKVIKWRKDPNLDERDSNGLTPFMTCMNADTAQSFTISKTLLEAGTNVHIPDPNNETGLEKAIRCSDPLVVKKIPPGKLIGPDPESTCFIMAAEYKKTDTLDYFFTRLANHRFTRAEVLAIMRVTLSHAITFGLNDPMVKIFNHHFETHKTLKKACQEALPGFSWIIHEGNVTLTLNGTPVSIEEIQKAINCEKCTPEAAAVFSISPVMLKCYRNNKTSIEELEDLINQDPSQLLQTNILGRNMLQVALIEGDTETKNLLLTYERQRFDNPDHRGNQPLHYAAALFDHASYRQILHKASLDHLSSSNPKEARAIAKNKLELIPLMMTLLLPKRMLPESTLSSNPYLHLKKDFVYTDEMHTSFCSILDDTLDLYRSNNKLNCSPEAELNPYNYKTTYGWNLLHYASVYGESDQAYAIAKRLPKLFFDRHKAKGRLPLQQALFRKQFKAAQAMIHGWLDQEESCELTPRNKISVSKSSAISLLPSITEIERSKSDSIDNIVILNRDLSSYGLSLWAILSELGDIDLLERLSGHIRLNEEKQGTDHDNYFRFSTSSDINQYRIGCNPFAIAVQTAIRKNNLDLLLYLAKKDPISLLVLQDSTGNTPLMLASSLRRAECVDILLKHAAFYENLENYISIKNKSDQNALHILCSTSRARAVDHITKETKLTNAQAVAQLDKDLEKCFSLLTERGIKIDQKDDNENTALHLICGYNHACLIPLVWAVTPKKEREKVFNAVNDDLRTPIFAAVANASLDSFRALIKLRNEHSRFDLQLNKRDVNGYTLLHIAAQEGHEGHEEICSTLISLGVNLTTRDEKGENVIHKAAFNRRLDILKYLLTLARSGSNKEAMMERDLSGMSALHKALLLPPSIQRKRLRRSCQRVAESRLISSIPTPTHRTKALSPQDMSSLLNPLTNSRLLDLRNEFNTDQIKLINEVITCLLDFGFIMEDGDRLGLSSWHYLMRGPYTEVLKHILAYYAQRKSKVDFSCITSHAGETLAHLSSKFGQTEQLKLILPFMSLKAINLKSTTGFTAASTALLAGHLDCFELLMNKGCRLDQTTRKAEFKRSSKVSKGDNLLHQIVDKPNLDDRLSDLFERISNTHPELLLQPNAANKTVLGLLSTRGHGRLLPLTIARMPNNRHSKAVIQKSLEDVQTILDSNTVKRGLETHISKIQQVLAYASLEEYLGQGLTYFHNTKKDAEIPTFDSLSSRATITGSGSTTPSGTPMASLRVSPKATNRTPTASPKIARAGTGISSASYEVIPTFSLKDPPKKVKAAIRPPSPSELSLADASSVDSN